MNETFKYYPTQPDAVADTNEITDQINHTASDGDSIWVRTISTEGCYRISKLDITISFASDVNYNEEFTTCDDFLDAEGNNSINNDDRDGIANFDISSAITPRGTSSIGIPPPDSSFIQPRLKKTLWEGGYFSTSRPFDLIASIS